MIVQAGLKCMTVHLHQSLSSSSRMTDTTHHALQDLLVVKAVFPSFLCLSPNGSANFLVTIALVNTCPLKQLIGLLLVRVTGTGDDDSQARRLPFPQPFSVTAGTTQVSLLEERVERQP